MDKTKNNGITLVALVVTIIILLILAGITISQLSGSGLFENAKLAEQKSKEAEEKEEGILADYENKIGEYINSDRASTPANSENTMSGTEHFTGEYYFNGKPIYAKSIYISSLPNATTYSYYHNIENVETIWYDVSKSYIFSSVGTWGHFNSGMGTNVTAIMLLACKQNYFNLKTGADRTSYSAYVTLNYTKTTDTATGEINIPEATGNELQ